MWLFLLVNLEYLCRIMALLLLQIFIFVLMVFITVIFAACGAVRICGYQDHWQHHDRHYAAAVYVCLYRSSAFQGTIAKSNIQ